MKSIDAESGQPITRAQARAQGLTNRQINRARRNGGLLPVRHGVVRLPGPEPSSGLPIDLAATLLAVKGRDLVVSHESAARLLALPRPLNGWTGAYFTATTGSPRKTHGAHIRVAPLAPTEIIEIAGVAVTSPARTIADCLRTLPHRDALAMTDAAWRLGLVTESSLLAAVEEQSGWPGVVAARKLLAHADPRRESPLESWSALAFARARVRKPEWQAEIRDSAGALVGRADCWWPTGVIGEADGKTKYALGAAERGGGAAAVFDVLHAERDREQRFRKLGCEIIRWTAADVLVDSRLKSLAGRIDAAIQESLVRPRFSGAVSIMHPPYAQ